MTKSISMIRFKAELLRPAKPAEGGPWTFLILPKDASAKLATRGLTTVEGTINGYPFRATLEPDGQRGHWLRVNRKVREAAGAAMGDVVTLEIMPAGEEPEPRVSADLRNALAAAPKAGELWSDITPIARRDWIHWIRWVPAGESLPGPALVAHAATGLAAGWGRRVDVAIVVLAVTAASPVWAQVVVDRFSALQSSGPAP